MKIWIFTTKDADELRQLEDNDFIKMASPKDVNIGDIIIVYSQINNNIKYILEAQRKAYKDKNFRPPWEIFVDLSNKIELMDPLERDEIENDSQLESWSFVKGNFGDIFTEVPPKSWEPLKNLILNKNPSNSEYINHLMINKWFFAIQDSFYEELKMSNEIIWHSPDDIKKEDIIFVYTASPKSSVGFILKAITDPYEDPDASGNGKLLLKVRKEITIPVPITLSELKDNSIIKNGKAVKMGFLGSHFQMFQEEYDELKKIILSKNSQLVNQFIELERKKTQAPCFNDNHRGRAHVTRDICYLVHENPNLTENVLTQLLIEKVGDNEDYWRAYFQNCQKENCVGYNLESARSLGLIECDKLILTDKGQELITKLEDDELFTYTYGIGTKLFFYKLALNNEVIKTAMNILKKNKKLRFWSPKCDRTNKVIWEYHHDKNDFICDEKKHPECADCDNDVLKHVDQTSLVLETLKKTGKRSGFVFWFTSRVTPMHLTGQEPAYNGQNIYWDEKEAKKMDHKTTQDSNIKWVFTVNKKNFHKLTDDITWNSALEVKNEDLILFYRGEPESAITDIFIAKTDPYDDAKTKEAIGGKAIDLHRLAMIMDPISWKTIKNNPILKEWAGVKWNFGKSHFKTSDEVRDELKRLIIEKNPELEDIIGNGTEIPKPFLIIKTLFNEFKITYLSTSEGIEHIAKYDLERQKVQKYFDLIKTDEKAIQDFDDPPINHLLPIKQPAVAPVAVGDIRAYGHKNEDLPGLTKAVRILIEELQDNIPNEDRKTLISTFKHGRYKDGFQTAMLTPTLYYLHPDCWFINKKTVATFHLFSELLNDNETISGTLDEYIDNNQKVHKLVDKLKKYIPELEFETFDAFCHWMTSESLANYANDEKKFKKWLVKHGFESEDEGNDILDEYDSFSEFLAEKNYLYSPETIENFLLSLKVKPFVILTGNSGTGKTKIAQLFAEYLETKNKGNYQIIPVGANWTENRHLIGFYNVIIQDYQTTPTLDLLLTAMDDEDNPYLIILDEMNLSHVERYFADFLSAMESGESIPLHSNNGGEKELFIPEDFEITNNVLVVGTVNVDETTYMFSPKVLDRANTIEFATYPAKKYILGESEDHKLRGNIEYLEDPLSNLDIREAKIDYLKNALSDVEIPEGTDLWTFLAEEIHKFQETLAEAGFDFGFRVIDEILRFMYVAWVYEKKPDNWTNWRRYFDAQIMQKMLPKIHGSQRELDTVLEKLFKLCYPHKSDNNTWYLQELTNENLLYSTSAKKLQWMGKTLQEKRFVSFTN